MPQLKTNPTLKDFQQYVHELEIERGFDKSPNVQTAFQMVEEVGELFKAVRKKEGMNIDPASAISSLEDEIADVFLMLLCIAEEYDIDVEQAVRKKEEKNAKRTWIKHAK